MSDTSGPLGPGAEAARIVGVLAAHQVEFVVCGGAACILQGLHSRVTADIDLLVHLTNENLKRFVQAARELRLQPRMPEPLEAIADPQRRRAWIEQKQAVVSTYTSPALMFQVDVFLAYPISYDDLAANADKMRFGNVEFLVSSKADLIRAKQQVRPERTIDQRDIADLQGILERERQAKS